MTNTTSKQISQQLWEAGFRAETAWAYDKTYSRDGNTPVLTLSSEGIPAYDFETLLKALPVDEVAVHLATTPDGKCWWLRLFGKEKVFGETQNELSADLAGRAVLWCIKEGYLITESE